MPLILLTNDDGINAHGLNCLFNALNELGVGDVVVAAPSHQQSAVSHSITLGQPLRVKTIASDFYAVKGTPADAAYLGMFELCNRIPDIVVSGINHGANVGRYVFYSGTIAAALEASIRGIPSVAVSQQIPATLTSADSNEWGKDPFEYIDEQMNKYLKNTARFAACIISSLLKNPFPKGICLNINGPSCIANSYSWTRIGNLAYRGQVEKRIDPRGIPYYWIGGSFPQETPDEPGTDLDTINRGLFSLTPLSLDWTAKQFSLPKWDLEHWSLALTGYVNEQQHDKK